jgi:hypothetical protein
MPGTSQGLQLTLGFRVNFGLDLGLGIQPGLSFGLGVNLAGGGFF